MRYIAFFLIMICLPATAQENQKLKTIFHALDSIEKVQRIEGSWMGLNAEDLEDGNWEWKHPDRYNFQKIEEEKEIVNSKRPYLRQLENLKEKNLSVDENINREIRILQLKDELADIDYKMYLIPFNAEGGFYNAPTFFLNNLPYETYDHYKSYLNWLPTYAEYVAYNQSLMEQGIEEKIQAPKIIVKNTINLLEPWTNLDELEKNPFYQPLTQIPDAVTPAQSAELQSEAKAILKEKIVPAYESFQGFLQNEYLKTANENPGVCNLANGKEYYENRITHYTTLGMTPNEVFNVGMAEVARIKQRMDSIITAIDFSGDFNAFLEYLRTEPQFYPNSPQELLNQAAWFSKKAEGGLPKLFKKLYSLPFTVEPVPESIAPNYTTGRYVGGSRSQDKPGIYWVNTYDLNSRTLYTLPALTLHEAVPGHHLQNAIASELEGLPDFRANYYISAFGEGWGLYSEYLGEEMGMYENAYDWFGRYTYEMWRACRLVVDVGIHYKNWDRQKALDFMAKNTALSLHEVNTEIDRYIGWPGQAVSYKIGEITIKKLRAKAEQELGESFDIQEFHYQILKNGSVPLNVLKDQISAYIDRVKSEM